VGLKDFGNVLANCMGFFVGKSHNAFSSVRKKLEESTNLPEKIRNSIFEKLSRSLARQAEFLVGKISERMEVIDEVSQPFYEKINALKACGPVSESQLWEAMSSIEAARKLTDEEKVLLVNLFGQIVGAQKSKVIDAVVVENDNSANRKSKTRLNAGTNR